MADESRRDDALGGPGHTVVLAVLLVYPILKVAWTVGSGPAAWDVLIALKPANWVDVVMGMLRGSAVLSFILSVVVSRMVFLVMATRGSLPATGGRRTAAAVALGSLISPVAFGLAMTVFFDWRWGVATVVTAWLLRQAVILEYRTGHRGHRERSAALAPWQHRLITAERVAATLLTVAVLPVVGFAVALNGMSWATLDRCQVQIGTAQPANTLIELDRDGSGVVGWDLEREQLANGTGCEKLNTLVVREPWWRS